MWCVKSVQGPRYGSLWWLSVIVTASVALLLGIAAALGVAAWGEVSAAVIGMLILSVVIHRSAVITVDSEGVHWRLFGGVNGSTPWSDIERVESHRLSGRLARKSSSKRVFFSMLDPHWRDRVVTKAIQAYLADVNRPTMA
jgi:hypothetical protein